eukprot:TRINITY_DN67611_c0_g1_i1.p1 TRINITY_DN67611_c0_g1~~TRINITY_DN67611_c0_g1_i1.p1  ORF type:complete len:343 (+),score=59.91 TRINITY_DN67611_c0_g1_i1:55-1083(+)
MDPPLQGPMRSRARRNKVVSKCHKLRSQGFMLGFAAFLSVFMCTTFVVADGRCWKKSRSTSRLLRQSTDTEEADKSKPKPIVAVLGAGGRTGALVVESLLSGGQAKPRALTRSGQWSPVSSSVSMEEGEIELGKADVTDASSLAAALAGVSAVIFAAAYSKGQSEPKDVDYQGLVNCAKIVRELKIPRLVVVSSCAVTRPYAPVGILLNTIGSGVLNEKLKGEDEMKNILKGSESTYTVVRPGGLKMDDAVGCANLEFNQGDTVVGNVPRKDVAAVCVVAATDPRNPGKQKTFEMYTRATKDRLLPWYKKFAKYRMSGNNCGDMMDKLRPDKDVIDVPGLFW